MQVTIPPINEEMRKFIHGLLTHMVNNKGSDLFITAGYPPAMKLDGKLTKITDKPLTADHAMQIVRSIMDDKQAEEFLTTNECNFAISLPGVSRFRINAMVQRGAAALVCRVITSDIPKFDNMNLPPVLKQVVMEKRGLVIFVGGTGSGKSTSLAAMIDYRNENSYGHIITIEDPIEFVHPHKNCIITQREVGVDTENWFAALKNTLRQAPDVILIGEIRDRETMDYALAFAETGHLCMATLHANNSNQALDRIINFFPEERRTQLLNDLSLNLKGFISQRLVPKKQGKGRVAAVEILLNSPLISELVLHGDIHAVKEIMAKSRDIGMQTFDQSLFDLYEADLISYDDALRNADSVNDLRLQIQLNSKKNATAGSGGVLDGLSLTDYAPPEAEEK
ncbi:PilT/PilU family type 4a pilus ATPase [Kingella kingae]|uniref:PilT/PilU family type 4a pilus ATPase n=1 Tax=Kingella kingae TaxID=504 RepID=UPI0004298BFF|nr:PilT/PilU family type 4a pilus ATPase [Kingella kingae]MDK4525449.1 PilT/PilU family type 4a pilus ATPase [Kingella kingae]MDK4531474.1 PilT/PilU family type 4a pilus ATPase [Kingella kingae]MDK4608934.1 PilT/PilU family type 4a pilus ATPase [Kingella kingae]MDK4626869.1 PilT/PilU family type 4a pilus ATPase [Kingella kingae]MDK4674598.1 PilT/PilU family type 4a pilus ATPase [Kingella kingae]